MTFLNNAAAQIWNQYREKISEHLFLFPSRRSMLYFKRAITEAAGKNLWVPDCLTLENWILDQSDFLPVDSITSTYQLYLAAIDIRFIDYSFEVFYPMAQVILSDFEEVDMAMIDAQEFWTHTSAWQNISEKDHPGKVWDDMKDTPLKERWEVNWNKLRELYRSFEQRLENQKLSTRGRIYRETASSLTELTSLDYPQIHVIGFSNLTKAEVRVLDHFKSKQPVLFYWNVISEMRTPGIDAGKHVVKWCEHFGQDLRESPVSKPEIEIISAAGMVAQLKMTSQILQEAEGKEDQMAVVLPHPSLIDLFLESFPDSRSLVNISLGYPLIYSPARSLIEWILGLWEKIELYSGRIRNSDLRLVWSHLYVSRYLYPENLSIVQSSRLYIDATDLAFDQPLSPLLFEPLKGPSDALERLISVIKELVQAQNELFHREVLRFVTSRLVRLNDVLAGIEGITYTFLKRILMEMLQGASIPFRGEPMQGVQVLGIQEVQNLAFDTLIIPGMNEEILPSGKIKSMIPYSLRRYYGLDEQGDQHSVQSYYLWSALLQARKVFLLYSQGDDFLGSRGMSRYLFQLKYSGVKVPLTERFLDLDLKGFEAKNKEVYLTGALTQRLVDYLQKEGLSPTALMSYITCPFQFFLKYVLRIKEDDTVVDGLDYRHMGSVIHDVMQSLYDPYIGKELDDRDFASIRASIREVTLNTYQKLYADDSPEMLLQGIHWVEQEIMIRAVDRIVSVDSRLKNLKIENLESDHQVKIDTERVENVILRGKIDRVDKVGTIYRIIDYKTGSSSLNQKSIAQNWEDRNPVHNWQLMFYAFLMKDQLGSMPYELGHYTLKDKNLYAAMAPGKKPNFDGLDIQDFENILLDILDTMTDPQVPFSQTEIVNRCEYCVFNAYCERQAHR